LSSLVNQDDKAAKCQDKNNDSCALLLPATSTRIHLPRHRLGCPIIPLSRKLLELPILILLGEKRKKINSLWSTMELED